MDMDFYSELKRPRIVSIIIDGICYLQGRTCVLHLPFVINQSWVSTSGQLIKREFIMMESMGGGMMAGMMLFWILGLVVLGLAAAALIKYLRDK